MSFDLKFHCEIVICVSTIVYQLEWQAANWIKHTLYNQFYLLQLDNVFLSLMFIYIFIVRRGAIF